MKLTLTNAKTLSQNFDDTFIGPNVLREIDASVRTVSSGIIADNGFAAEMNRLFSHVLDVPRIEEPLRRNAAAPIPEPEWEPFLAPADTEATEPDPVKPAAKTNLNKLISWIIALLVVVIVVLLISFFVN
jgi:hypothetical protein